MLTEFFITSSLLALINTSLRALLEPPLDAVEERLPCIQLSGWRLRSFDEMHLGNNHQAELLNTQQERSVRVLPSLVLFV